MIRNKSFEGDTILYLVSTPIGNLKELSPRAIEVFNQVDLICSEDTRTTSSLLKNFNISKPFISYHEHNEKEASEKIINLLKEGKKIALTSDAGYPGISDPGYILVKEAIKNNISLSVVNGSNAFIPALVGSGLNTNHFYFYGFLESNPTHRKKELLSLKEYPMTMIFYESPHRIIKTLQDMYQIFGDREVSIARELTKIHEEYIRGCLHELVKIDESTLKGEMVIVVDGNHQVKEELDEGKIKSMLQEEINKGSSKKDAIKKIVQENNLKKNQVYEIAMKL